jgi:phosphoadenosine phosphosulfate reductase
MNAFAEPSRPDVARLSGAAARAEALRERYGHLDGEALLRVMLEWDYRGRIALISSFGAEAAVLLDMVARIDAATPVIFIDTGKLFHETLTYHDILVRRLGLTDVRSIGPAAFDLAGHDPGGELWRRSPNLCCYLRKVLPLERALAGFDAWITGRKRAHGGERGALETIEAVDGRIRFNPLAHWSAADIDRAFRDSGLPRHPLQDEGYPSIGCAPCTEAADAAVDGGVRAGRWRGSAKSECGIHLPRVAPNRP